MPAGRPSPGGDAVEFLENALELGLRDARPLIGDRDDELCARSTRSDTEVGEPAGTYLSALSRRLKTTCSSKVASPRTSGRSGAIVTSIGRVGKARARWATALRTASPASTRSRLTFTAPASSRVMSSRLETKRDSRAVSSSIVARRSRRASAGILSPSWRRLVTAPMIEDERRAQIMRERGEQRAAQPLAFDRGLGLRRLVDELRALDGDGGLVDERRERPVVLGGKIVVRLAGLDADHAEDAARGAKRAELELRVRQGGGAPAGEFAARRRPARRRPFARPERILRRKGGAELELLLLAEKHEGAAIHRLRHMRHHHPEHVVELGDRRELARKIIKRLRGDDAPRGRIRLLAHAPGEPAGEHGDEKEDEQREELVRLGDGEGVDRLDEEEIIGEEGEHRREDRRARAVSARRKTARR